MYNTYLVFIIVLIFTFFTGNLILIAQSKKSRKELLFKNNSIVDEEIL